MRNEPNHVIVGDININILKESLTAVAHEYLDMLSSNGYTKFLLGETRGSSCLDHMFCKFRSELSVDLGIFETYLTRST